MAKNSAGLSGESKPFGRRTDEPDGASAKDGSEENRALAEDAEFESERDALKKARETDGQEAQSDDGADAFGNLHYGSPDRGGETAEGAIASDGVVAPAAGGIRALLQRVSDLVRGAERADRDAAAPQNDETSAQSGVDASVRRDASAHPEVSAQGERAAATDKGDGAEGFAGAPSSSGEEIAFAGTRQAFAASDEDGGEDNQGGGDNHGAPDGNGGGPDDNGGGNNGGPDPEPVNTAPGDLALSSSTVNENADGATVGVLSAVDPDVGDTLIYAIVDDASGLFELDGDVLRLKAGAAFDFEAQDSYDISVSATDASGASIVKTFTIGVNDVNEAPTGLDITNLSIAENDDGAIVGTLMVSDPDAGETFTFALSDSRFEVVDGALKVKDGVSFDAESLSAVDLTVTATDASARSQDVHHQRNDVRSADGLISPTSRS
ncbi:MAG: cadherin domain-containing protein [Parvularculaceae bacterium]